MPSPFTSIINHGKGIDSDSVVHFFGCIPVENIGEQAFGMIFPWFKLVLGGYTSEGR
jgi:hypothetical protein